MTFERMGGFVMNIYQGFVECGRGILGSLFACGLQFFHDDEDFAFSFATSWNGS